MGVWYHTVARPSDLSLAEWEEARPSPSEVRAPRLAWALRNYESAKRIYESNGQSVRVPWYLGTLP